MPRSKQAKTRRGRSIVHAVNQLGKLSKEELAARKAQARVEKAKADAEAQRIKAEAKAAEKASQLATKAANAELARKLMNRKQRDPSEPAPDPTPEPRTYTLKPGPDGVPVKVFDLPPATVSRDTVEPEPKAEPPAEDKRPPWLRRGESRPRDRTEWAAWQRERSGKANEDTVMPESPKALPLPGVSGPHGIRVGLPEKFSCYVAGHVPSNWREDWL